MMTAADERDRTKMRDTSSTFKTSLNSLSVNSRDEVWERAVADKIMIILLKVQGVVNILHP